MPEPLTEEEVGHLYVELIELAGKEMNGDFEPISVVLGPMSAYQLVGAIQLACRHPAMPDTVRQAVIRVADTLTAALSESELLARHIAAGWDSEQDA